MLLAVTNWTAVGVLSSIGLASIGALLKVASAFSRLTQRVDDNVDLVNKNARHVDSLITSEWMTVQRVTHIEDFLQDHGYRPVPVVNRPPGD